jgi:hypothetical protein
MVLALTLSCVLAAALPGCKSGSRAPQTKKVGGCEIETTAIGAGVANPAGAPEGAAWIRVCSVEFAGNDLYKKAADDLKRALNARAVRIHTCTELQHVKDGPCWPPYSIEYRVDLTEDAGGRMRTFLLQTPLANCRPVLERPEGYGTFFVSCGTGSSDWWAVWYIK